MISVRHRFHGHNSLRGVYSHGQTIRSQFVSLKFVDRAAGRPYRAAIVVSRKVHKSAVVRNRIRRRLYEVIRQADDELTRQRDLIFTVFSDQIADMPSAELTKTVEDLLRKAVNKSTNSSQTPVRHDIVNEHTGK